MFATDKAPPLAQAVTRAEQLVGTEALARAAKNPWIEAQIQFDVAVYDLAYRARQGSMPQLIIGTNVAVGTFPRNELLGLMERNWGLRAGP